MRDYGKVFTQFWESEDIRALSDDGRMLALYLMTCKHGTIAGVFRLPDGYVCEDTQWSPERVSEGFAELSAKGFANRCETTKWVWIRKHLEWNPPENPNQRKAAAKCAAGIPEKCCWLRDFLSSNAEMLRLEANGSGTLSQPLPNQKQEQKQEQEQKEEADASLPAGTPACPHADIVALYHELLPANPRIKVWDGARESALRTRWREDAKRQNLDYWRRFFAHVAASPFLTGQVVGKGDRAFLPGLDWLVTAGNFAKVIEGRYHDREAMA